LQLWATDILGSARFPDASLTQRAISFLAQKAAAPEDGILQGAKDPAAAKDNASERFASSLSLIESEMCKVRS